MSGSAIRAGSTITVAFAVVVSNWRLLTNKVKLAECAAVVKANANGLGATEVAPAQ